MRAVVLVPFLVRTFTPSPPTLPPLIPIAHPAALEEWFDIRYLDKRHEGCFFSL
jgi:hypothetical protein